MRNETSRKTGISPADLARLNFELWSNSTEELEFGSISKLHIDFKKRAEVNAAEDLVALVNQAAQLPIERVLHASIDPVETPFGFTVSGSLSANHYRQFLKRHLFDAESAKLLDEDKVTSFYKRVTNPNPVGEIISEEIRKVRKFLPTLASPHRYDMDTYQSFSGGAVAELPRSQSSIANKVRAAAASCERDYSEVLVVPKDYRGGRVIIKAPARLAFWQQGVRYALIMAHHEESSFHGLSTFCSSEEIGLILKYKAQVHLESQEGNRVRCNPFYDTIDMSDASDRLQPIHVELLIGGEWSDVLMTCRSPGIAYDNKHSGQCFSLPKEEHYLMCGMGDAETMITQSLCYLRLVFSLAIMILRDPESTSAQRFLAVRAIIDSRVYGDDVVVPHGFGPLFMRAGQDLGFVMNVEKSYCDDNQYTYRETCGVECISTPDLHIIYEEVRLPRGASLAWLMTSEADSFIAFVNAMMSFGLFDTVRWLLQRVADARPWLQCVNHQQFIADRTTPDDPLVMWSVDDICDITSSPLYLGKRYLHDPLIQTIRRGSHITDVLTLTPFQWDSFGCTFALTRIEGNGLVRSVRSYLPEPKIMGDWTPTADSNFSLIKTHVKCKKGSRCPHATCPFAFKQHDAGQHVKGRR